ncbi:FAD-binding oxidoreductase [Flavisphingomonas formosensis]|uniref:FAD-binding oxidoreductase n=1 Tax=Flavisphingomonas formosensis TaxID=861534 RepID=UPI0012FB304F|nr:FAD-binding oxidoreductase [Sphingomonas formosensis]
MSAGPVLIDALRALVGDRNLLAAAEDLRVAQADGRVADGSEPCAIVRPADAAQVSEIVRLAAGHGVPLVVQGGRTGLVGAGLAQQAGALILSLDRLDRCIEIDPVNRMATVDAGVRLSALNAAAAEFGLSFPIDLGADPMIGGMIAANTGGARFLRYGDVRTALKAVEVVRSDGTGERMRFGAALWKNNGGLDLKQLLVGSSGALGIVTRATVALQPLPQARLTALLALADPHAALMLLRLLEDGFGTLLTAFEGISGAALAAALRHVPTLRAPFGGPLPAYAVLIELSAGSLFDAAELEDKLGTLLAPLMERDGTPILDVATDRRDGLWAIRHAVPEGLRSEGAVVACDIALRRGDVMRFRDDLAARLAAAAPGLVLHDFGHIGDGGLHFNCVWPKAAGPLPDGIADRARAIVFDAVVTEYGGSFSAEHGVGPRNIAQYRRFTPPGERRIAGAMQRLIAPVPIGSVDFGTGWSEELDDVE